MFWDSLCCSLEERDGTDRFGVIGSGCQRIRVAGTQRPLEDVQQGFAVLTHLEKVGHREIRKDLRKKRQMKRVKLFFTKKFKWERSELSEFKHFLLLLCSVFLLFLLFPLPSKIYIFNSFLLIAKSYTGTHHWNLCVTHKQRLPSPLRETCESFYIPSCFLYILSKCLEVSRKALWIVTARLRSLANAIIFKT